MEEEELGVARPLLDDSTVGTADNDVMVSLAEGEAAVDDGAALMSLSALIDTGENDTFEVTLSALSETDHIGLSLAVAAADLNDVGAPANAPNAPLMTEVLLGMFEDCPKLL